MLRRLTGGQEAPRCPQEFRCISFGPSLGSLGVLWGPARAILGPPTGLPEAPGSIYKASRSCQEASRSPRESSRRHHKAQIMLQEAFKSRQASMLKTSKTMVCLKNVFATCSASSGVRKVLALFGYIKASRLKTSPDPSTCLPFFFSAQPLSTCSHKLHPERASRSMLRQVYADMCFDCKNTGCLTHLMSERCLLVPKTY